MDGHMSPLSLSFWFVSSLLAVPGDSAAPPPKAPQIAKASEEGQKAMVGFQKPPSFEVTLVAAEPLVANPVAFTIDNRGRIFICESFRQNNGVTDNRGHDEKWLKDDLAAMTVADRDAYHRKHLGAKGVAQYTAQDDRIHLLEDRDGDGKIDHDSIFAERFNQLVDGTGAGILVRGNDVWYTCIPNVWKLRDGGKGVAESRDLVQDGFGVRVAFRGHDMHGLVMGADGRIYFSIGDRGYNFTSKEGRKFVNPETGGVFRCLPDGSQMEVFATGLRNPQELAFDDFGNLFTGDNNSDSGDRARWVYVVEGGETGWRMAYQYLGDRGPWNREKLWHPFHEGQAAYIVPPIANFCDGPSGLAHYPGTGFGEEYRNSFFLVDFRGGPGNSGVWNLRVKSKGAGFELGETKQFFWRCLATDVDFGPDGAMYATDWVNGWNGEGKGRLYKVAPTVPDPRSAQVKKLLADGMTGQKVDGLVTLLRHPDRRVRLEAQFELVNRKAEHELSDAAKSGDNLLARLHAIWGLGQILRVNASNKESFSTISALLIDNDAEVRAQAVKVAGEIRGFASHGQITSLLADPNTRVRFFASISAGKLAKKVAFPAIAKVLAENADADPWLRHAGIMGLVGTASSEELAKLTGDPSESVRVAAVVALRRQKSPLVAKFLQDPAERVVVETARAIHDEPIYDALPQLASMIARPSTSDPLLRRVLNANFRLGGAEQAKALAEFAARGDAPENMRKESLAMLAAWKTPDSRDRVLNQWRPIEPRAVELAVSALQAVLPRILTAAAAIRTEGVKVAAQLGITEVAPALREILRDTKRGGEARAEALLALGSLGDKELDALVKTSLTDAAPMVRAAGRELLLKKSPAEAIPLLTAASHKGETVERQSAYAALAGAKDPAADEALGDALDELLAGKLPIEVRLDVLDAARRHSAAPIKERLAKYDSQYPQTEPTHKFREALAGGNAERGKKIFFERASVSCVRCHTIDNVGGPVGPNLSKIGGEKTREYLLESMVSPSKTIAKGFESVVLELDDGRVVAGILRSEDAKQLQLITAEGKTLQVDKTRVVDRNVGKSAMPEDVLKLLTPAEVRDVLEYLATRK